jgi:hypothetical protein
MELRRVMDRALRQREVIARSVALREQAARISGAMDLGAMLEAVERAFEQTDYAEAEIRFMPTPGEREKDEIVWHWEQPPADPATQVEDPGGREPRLRMSRSRLWARNAAAEYWETRIPLVAPDADAVTGWLTVRRPLRGHSLAELDLLTNTLPPAVSRLMAAAGEAGEQLELVNDADPVAEGLGGIEVA